MAKSKEFWQVAPSAKHITGNAFPKVRERLGGSTAGSITTSHGRTIHTALVAHQVCVGRLQCIMRRRLCLAENPENRSKTRFST